MAWLTMGDDDRAILGEIERQTDRGVALIATAYLEERLIGAIKARTNRHEQIENKIYRHSGPLSSFSAKIDLGLLLGIYDITLHKMLHTVREIRNEFAHQARPRDFRYQRIEDLCRNLNGDVCFEITNVINEKKYLVDLKPDGTPRTAFLNAVKLLLLYLHMEIVQLPPRKPAPPVMPPLR